MSGQMVKSQSYSNQMDVSDLPNGIYIVQIQTNNTSYRRKIVKK